MSSFLRGPCTKNYCIWFIFDRVIPKIKRVTFFRTTRLLILSAGGYCTTRRHAVGVSMCLSPKIVRLTPSTDQNVLVLILTFLSHMCCQTMHCCDVEDDQSDYRHEFTSCSSSPGESIGSTGIFYFISFH